MIAVAVIEESGEFRNAVAGGMCGTEGPVMVRCAKLAIPSGACKVSCSGIDDAVAPMYPEDSLTAQILCPPHVPFKPAGAELRKPHGWIILDPGNGPALAASQVAECLDRKSTRLNSSHLV